MTRARRFKQFRLVLWLLVLVGSSLIPSLVLAQTNDGPPALCLTIRDSEGHGVSGAMVLVTDRSGGQIFARAMTDSDGQASVAMLPTGDVRVRVSGQWNGIALSQTGADAQGVLLLGGDPPLTLDLRVTPDGQVIPDPATMIAPDLAGPAAPIPTAPIAAVATPGWAEHPRLPEATTLGGPADAGSAGIVEDFALPQPAQPESPDGTALVVIGVCLVLGLVLLVMAIRWGRAA